MIRPERGIRRLGALLLVSAALWLGAFSLLQALR